MFKSENITDLAVALSKAQKNIGSAAKGATNPFFKSKYADLAAVMEACKEHLNNEGITVLQPVSSEETGDYVETILLHSSGQWVSSKMKLHPSKNMQEFGSATSYARRYSLQSLVFIPQVDDDYESGMGRDKPKLQSKAETSKEAPSAPLETPKTANPWRKAGPTVETPKASDGMSF